MWKRLALRNVSLIVCLATLGALTPKPVNAGATDAWLRSVDRMMLQLAPQSAGDAAAIRTVYQPYLELLLLHKYADLEGALATGGLVPLPSNLKPFNIEPRLGGLHPIAEKDLSNQATYLTARPATIGALIVVASRVRSTPVEVTSLVRHSEYQQELRASNGNANTSVPMHTMGLAFDIALVNTPLDGVREIRDVLLEMRKAGDILFIGERHQLVFHVVPNPARLGHFNDVYARAVGSISSSQVVEVVAPGPPRVDSHQLVPRVVADVVAVRPSSDHWHEWNAALASDAGTQVVPIQASVQGVTAPIAATALVRGVLALVAALFTTAWRIARFEGLLAGTR